MVSAMRDAIYPYVTSDFPGIGGRLRVSPSDFYVEERPAYLPCGEGDHIYAWIEKTQMTTAFLVSSLARALNLRESDIGVAGMKDKYAQTQQMVSLPPPLTPEQVMACSIEGATIVRASRHGNKLKTGHLKGNLFVLRVRELACPLEEAKERATLIIEQLAKVPGAPNWYGAQRFGRGGDNAQVGKALVTQSPLRGKTPKGRQRRLFISAYQSQLFNEYLAERLNDNLFSTVLEGDLLQKRDSGGVFTSEDTSIDQARFTSGEVGLCGPMFGHKTKMPLPQSPALAREERILEREDLSLQSFAHLKKLAMGARRPLSVVLDDVRVSIQEDSLEIAFSLPPGSYATTIMREIMKGPDNFPA